MADTDTLLDTLINTPVLHLLIELMENGKARILPELEPLEPIDVNVIVAALHRKTGLTHGKDFNAWCGWFLERSDSTIDERMTLIMMRKMVATSRYFTEKIGSEKTD